MNLRVTLKNDRNETVHCVVSAAGNLEQEMERVFSIQKGYGLGIDVTKTQVKVVNYFRADTLASFDIVSIVPTEEPLQYRLTADTPSEK